MGDGSYGVGYHSKDKHDHGHSYGYGLQYYGQYGHHSSYGYPYYSYHYDYPYYSSYYTYPYYGYHQPNYYYSASAYYPSCDDNYISLYADEEAYRFYDADLYDTDQQIDYGAAVPATVLPGSDGSALSAAVSYGTEEVGTEVDAILARGRIAFVDERFEEARRLFAEAMFLDDLDGRAKFLYALASLAVGNVDLAGLALRRALLTTPELIENPWDLRTLYADGQAFDIPLSRVVAFVADQPQRRDAQLVLGYLYFGWGESERAHTYFNRLALTDSDDILAARLRDSAFAIIQGAGSGR